jgi:hypothetical protein
LLFHAPGIKSIPEDTHETDHYPFHPAEPAYHAQHRRRSSPLRCRGYRRKAGQQDPRHQGIRTHTALGLKECKELTEKTPSLVKSGISRIEADRIQKDLTTAGATADVRPTP